MHLLFSLPLFSWLKLVELNILWIGAIWVRGFGTCVTGLFSANFDCLLLVFLQRKGCLLVVEAISLDYWTYYKALYSFEFPFTIFLMCFSWNHCSLLMVVGFTCVSHCVSLSKSNTWSLKVSSCRLGSSSSTHINYSFLEFMGFTRNLRNEVRANGGWWGQVWEGCGETLDFYYLGIHIFLCHYSLS